MAALSLEVKASRKTLSVNLFRTAATRSVFSAMIHRNSCYVSDVCRVRVDAHCRRYLTGQFAGLRLVELQKDLVKQLQVCHEASVLPTSCAGALAYV